MITTCDVVQSNASFVQTPNRPNSGWCQRAHERQEWPALRPVRRTTTVSMTDTPSSFSPSKPSMSHGRERTWPIFDHLRKLFAFKDLIRSNFNIGVASQCNNPEGRDVRVKLFSHPETAPLVSLHDPSLAVGRVPDLLEKLHLPLEISHQNQPLDAAVAETARTISRKF